MRNILIEELNPSAQLISGSPKPLSMMQGIDGSFDAAFFIGYHAQAGTAYHMALDLAGNRGPEGETAAWVNEVSMAAADCFHQLGDRAQVIATYEKVLAGALPPQATAAALFRLGVGHQCAGDAIVGQVEGLCNFSKTFCSCRSSKGRQKVSRACPASESR